MNTRDLRGTLVNASYPLSGAVKTVHVLGGGDWFAAQGGREACRPFPWQDYLRGEGRYPGRKQVFSCGYFALHQRVLPN